MQFFEWIFVHDGRQYLAFFKICDHCTTRNVEQLLETVLAEMEVIAASENWLLYILDSLPILFPRQISVPSAWNRNTYGGMYVFYCISRVSAVFVLPFFVECISLRCH